jgi:hypothetical protein
MTGTRPGYALIMTNGGTDDQPGRSDRPEPAHPDRPDQLLEAVDEEVREQEAIDRFDEPPAAKVERRDLARSALEDELDIEPEPGPNPA